MSKIRISVVTSYRVWFLLSGVVLYGWLAGCGYIGDPQPPALQVPPKPSEVEARQVGEKLVVRLSVPEQTLDGVPLKRARVELVALPGQEEPPPEEEWTTKGQPLASSEHAPGHVVLERAVSEWAGQTLWLRVRLVNQRGRPGEWSDPLRIRIVPALKPPSRIEARVTGEGVRLSWSRTGLPEGVRFRVLRRSAAEAAFRAVGEEAGAEWLDEQVTVGQKYEYRLAAFLSEGSVRAESELSEPVTVEVVDRFAPPTPKGLTALVGPDSIELGWEPVGTADLRGYYLYRAEEGGDFAKLSAIVTVPSYSDKEVKRGRTYRYSVSAVDRAGNESERSEAVEAKVR